MLKNICYDNSGDKMKLNTYCSSCNQLLNPQISEKFEQFSIGYVTCKHCKKKQKRYLSEADILLYFSVSAIIYCTLLLVIVNLLNIFRFNPLNIIGIILLFVAGYIAIKTVGAFIYSVAPFRKNIAEINLKQDKEPIQKRLKWQFIMFMLLALFLGSQEELFMPFLILLILFIAITFIKVYLSNRNDNNQVKEDLQN